SSPPYPSDHSLGVISLIWTLGLQGSDDPMRLHGPRGAKKVLSQAISLGVERVLFGVSIEETKPGTALSRDGYEIRVFATEHGGGSVGYAFMEKERSGRFDSEQARDECVTEWPTWCK